MSGTPKKKAFFRQDLMALLMENLNKEFTGSGLATQFGCAETSIPPVMRMLRAAGWDVVRTGNGRYLCRSIGSLSLNKGETEELPFIPKSKAVQAPEDTALVAPASPAATPSGINVGDLLEVSHVTRQGVMVAMDATGNAYKVVPL